MVTEEINQIQTVMNTIEKAAQQFSAMRPLLESLANINSHLMMALHPIAEHFSPDAFAEAATISRCNLKPMRASEILSFREYFRTGGKTPVHSDMSVHVSNEEECSVGFIFGWKMNEVYLARNKVEGETEAILSGIGGHRSEKESHHDAVCRYAKEAAAHTGKFVYYGTVSGSSGLMHIYYSVMRQGQAAPKTCSEQQIERIPFSRLLKDVSKMGPNLPWLIIATAHHHLLGESGIFG